MTDVDGGRPDRSDFDLRYAAAFGDEALERLDKQAGTPMTDREPTWFDDHAAELEESRQRLAALEPEAPPGWGVAASRPTSGPTDVLDPDGFEVEMVWDQRAGTWRRIDPAAHYPPLAGLAAERFNDPPRPPRVRP